VQKSNLLQRLAIIELYGIISKLLKINGGI